MQPFTPDIQAAFLATAKKFGIDFTVEVKDSDDEGATCYQIGDFYLDNDTEKRGGWRLYFVNSSPGGRWHPPENWDVTLFEGHLDQCLNKIILAFVECQLSNGSFYETPEPTLEEIY